MTSRKLAASAPAVAEAEAAALPAVFVCSLVNGGPDEVCVHVAGELDIATAPKLELALREALRIARLVIVDLRDVEFIDSAGVHAIVSATAQAQVLARRVAILRGPSSVDRIFKLTGTYEQVEFAHADALGPVCAEARRRRSRLMRSRPVLRALS